MAVFNASNTDYSINISSGGTIDTYFGQLNYGDIETPLATSTRWVESGDDGQAIWSGTGLTYGASSWSSGVYRTDPSAGSFTALTFLNTDGETVFTLTGLTGVAAGTSLPLLTTIFANADTVTGGSGNDILWSGAGNDIVNGGIGDDTIDGSTGNDTLNGGDGDDAFRMNSDGADVIDGGSGIDLLDYTSSALTTGIALTLGVAGAVATATNADGNDSVKNVENVSGAAGNDTLVGNELANVLSGNNGNDNLNGNAGNDTIEGGQGKDTLAGGAGFDYVQFGSSGTAITSFNIVSGALTIVDYSATQTETVTGFEGAIGTAGSDVITGAGNTNTSVAYDLDGGLGEDSLTGGAGNDTLRGANDTSTDTLTGGAGNDLYVISFNPATSYYDYNTYTWVNVPASADVVTEATSAGTDTVRLELVYTYDYTNPNYTLANNVENLIVDTQDGSNNGMVNSVSGNALNNVITALSDTTTSSYYAENFKLYGAAGNDTINGSSGADTLVGGSGNDSMIGGEGDDTYYIDVATDTIVELADEGRDTVFSTINVDLTPLLKSNLENVRLVGDVASTIVGNALNNLLVGNALANTLTGNDGNDGLYGGAGNDTISGGNGDDYVNGGTGNDSIDGGSGIDTISFAGLGAAIKVNLATATAQITGAGTDMILGFENAGGSSLGDTLLGTNAANTLSGEGGNDFLKGAGGIDLLMGSDGNDSLFGGSGADVLTGGGGNDLFYFDSLPEANADSITDFLSGADKVLFDMSSFGAIGDGDTAVDGALRWGYKGGFESTAELVIFTQNVPTVGHYDFVTWDANTVASSIGNAATAYAAGDQRIFVVDNGTQTAFYKFISSAADATISGSELSLVGTASYIANTQLADYGFVA